MRVRRVCLGLDLLAGIVRSISAPLIFVVLSSSTLFVIMWDLWDKPDLLYRQMVWRRELLEMARFQLWMGRILWRCSWKPFPWPCLLLWVLVPDLELELADHLCPICIPYSFWKGFLSWLVLLLLLVFCSCSCDCSNYYCCLGCFLLWPLLVLLFYSDIRFKTLFTLLSLSPVL